MRGLIFLLAPVVICLGYVLNPVSQSCYDETTNENLKCTNAHSVSQMSLEEIQKELSFYAQKFGFVRPQRSTVDPDRQWKNGVPNYDAADLLYFRGKTKNHLAGSLENVVENLVKEWEMEATHLHSKHWTLVDHSSYKISSNGGKAFNVSENGRVGNYNALLADVDKSLYDNEKETWESSHALFGKAFDGGFPWEILEVFSGPPKAVWSWRHWGIFNGEYKGKTGDRKVYEMYGIGVAVLNAKGKITDLEIYYKPNEFLKAMEGKLDASVLAKGGSIVGSGCPFINAS